MKYLNVSLKPLDQFLLDFILGFLLNEYCQFVHIVLHYRTRWSLCPYMVKQLKSSPEARSFGVES